MTRIFLMAWVVLAELVSGVVVADEEVSDAVTVDSVEVAAAVVGSVVGSVEVAVVDVAPVELPKSKNLRRAGLPAKVDVASVVDAETPPVEVAFKGSPPGLKKR